MTHSKSDALNKVLPLGIYNGIFMWSLQGWAPYICGMQKGGFKFLKGLRVNRCFDLLILILFSLKNRHLYVWNKAKADPDRLHAITDTL